MELSLYIHIPFCTVKCDYCSFYSVGGSIEDDVERRFLQRLLAEIEEQLESLEPTRIPSVYIGGGTPNALSSVGWRDLLNGVSSLLKGIPPGGLAREWSVEVNPELLTREQLEVADATGVNRISVGVQSFDDTVLATIGRVNRRASNLRGLALLQEGWRHRWSADLICEIPGQTVAGALKDWECLKSYSPPHLSLYTLGIEEGTPLARRFAQTPPAPIDDTVWVRMLEQLALDNYHHYEISNHVRRGEERSRHNMHYWQMRPYAGFGPGAVSTIRIGERVVRATNPPDLTGYLRGDTLPVIEEPTPREFLMDILMMGMRTDVGVSLSEIEHIFHVTFHEMVPIWLREELSLGRLKNSEGRLCPTEEGLRFLNPLLGSCFLELDRYRGELGDLENWPIDES